MGVVPGRPIGELGQMQRAEPDLAGILEPLQGGRRHGRHEIAADPRAAGRDLARIVIHVLVGERHAVQRTTQLALGKLGIGGIGRLQRGFGLDRHEGVEMRLPLRDAMQQRACDLMRGDLLHRDRTRDLGERHQGRLSAHFDTFRVCASG
ncbi:hypothetical protein ACVW16_003080 [Bradyrhizobium sp. USDA 4474]